MKEKPGMGYSLEVLHIEDRLNLKLFDQSTLRKQNDTRCMGDCGGVFLVNQSVKQTTQKDILGFLLFLIAQKENKVHTSLNIDTASIESAYRNLSKEVCIGIFE